MSHGIRSNPQVSQTSHAAKTMPGISRITAVVQKSRARSAGLPASVEVLRVKYPQGAEKMLIDAIYGVEVPAGGSSSSMDTTSSVEATVVSPMNVIYIDASWATTYPPILRISSIMEFIPGWRLITLA